MLLWPLLTVNLRILGLTWRGTIYFVQNNRTIILPDDTRQTASELHDFGTTLEAWGLKIFHNFHFLQSDVVFGMTNSFSGIDDAVSSEKSYSTSFLLTYIEFRTVEFFPPAESWFQARQPYTRLSCCMVVMVILLHTIWTYHSGQSQSTPPIQWANQNSKSSTADAKLGETCISESQLVVVILTSHWLKKWHDCFN